MQDGDELLAEYTGQRKTNQELEAKRASVIASGRKLRRNLGVMKKVRAGTQLSCPACDGTQVACPACEHIHCSTYIAKRLLCQISSYIHLYRSNPEYCTACLKSGSLFLCASTTMPCPGSLISLFSGSQVLWHVANKSILSLVRALVRSFKLS